MTTVDDRVLWFAAAVMERAGEVGCESKKPLTKHQMEVVYLAVVEGQGRVQSSVTLGRSLTSVDQRLRGARERLKYRGGEMYRDLYRRYLRREIRAEMQQA